jgi:iron complex outermembrane receptor protein
LVGSGWAGVLDFELTYYNHQIDDAIQTPDAQDGGMPRWQSNPRLDWMRGPLDPGWTVRHVHSSTGKRSDGSSNNPELSLTSLGLCSDPDPADPALSRNSLGATTHHDVYAGWNRPFGVETLKVSIGPSNAFAKQPPTCLSCSLNGHDPGTTCRAGSGICKPPAVSSESPPMKPARSRCRPHLHDDAASGIGIYP